MGILLLTLMRPSRTTLRTLKREIIVIVTDWTNSTLSIPSSWLIWSMSVWVVTMASITRSVGVWPLWSDMGVIVESAGARDARSYALESHQLDPSLYPSRIPMGAVVSSASGWNP